MTEISTYKHELYEFYELNHSTQTAASVTTTITVAALRPHADVIASSGGALKRTRVYVNGKLNAVTEVADADPNTTITVTDALAIGDAVDIYLATTTGSLQNNGSTGKLPATCDQLAQDYAAVSNEEDVGAGGTERTETVRYSDDGNGTIMFKRQGNFNMQNFILARKNKKYLMIIVKDTTVPATPTYDILHEVRIASYARGTEAGRGRKAMIIDTFEFTFAPPVSMTS